MPMSGRPADAIVGAGAGSGFGDLLSGFGAPAGEGQGTAPTVMADAMAKLLGPAADETPAVPESEAAPTDLAPKGEEAATTADVVPDQPAVTAVPGSAANAPMPSVPSRAEPAAKPDPAPAKDSNDVAPEAATLPRTMTPAAEPAPAADTASANAKTPTDKAPQNLKPNGDAVAAATSAMAAASEPVASGDAAATGRKDGVSLDRLTRREGRDKVAADDRAASGSDAHRSASSDPQPNPIVVATVSPAQDRSAPIVPDDQAGTAKAEQQPVAASSLLTGAADARHGDAATQALQPGQDNLPSLLASQTPASAMTRFAPAVQPYAAPAQVPAQPVIPAQTGRIGRDMGVEIARQVSAGRQEVLVRLDPA
jgi:hypothetical protein